jgi:hypothetical protein
MFKISEIVQTVKGIIETRVGLVKQEIQDEFVGILSRIILFVVMGFLLLFVFLFLSISLAFYLIQVTESPYMGFLIVALIYLLIVVVMFLAKDSLNIQDRIEVVLKGSVLKFKKKKTLDNE